MRHWKKKAEMGKIINRKHAYSVPFPTILSGMSHSLICAVVLSSLFLDGVFQQNVRLQCRPVICKIIKRINQL